MGAVVLSIFGETVGNLSPASDVQSAAVDGGEFSDNEDYSDCFNADQISQGKKADALKLPRSQRSAFEITCFHPCRVDQSLHNQHQWP